MNNKEAIEIIKVAKAEVEWDYPLDYQIAFDKAIESLEKQASTKPFHERNADFCLCGEYLTGARIYCSRCGRLQDWSDEYD